MILTAVYYMFITGEVFNPSDLFKIDMPQAMSKTQKEKAINKALKFLITKGVISGSDSTVT